MLSLSLKNKKKLSQIIAFFSFIVVIILLIGLVSMFLSLCGKPYKSFSLFTDNWLVLFAQYNQGLIISNEFGVTHYVDYILLICIGIIFGSKYILINKNIIKMVFGFIAAVSPFLGILFIGIYAHSW